MTSKSDKFKIFEPLLILFLFLHTFWNLIYFERSTALVFISFIFLTFALAYSFLKSWRGWRDFGIDLKHLSRGLVPLSFFVLFLIVASLLTALVCNYRPRFPRSDDFVSFMLWGILQQALIQGYFFRFFERTFIQNKFIPIFLTAIVFALFHIPNHALILITFLGGLYISWFFSRYRNLLLAGVAHGLISLTMVATLKPAGLISQYRVGPEPMPHIRNLISELKTEKTQIGQLGESQVPSSLDFQFPETKNLDSLYSLNYFLKQDVPVLVVLSKGDLKRFRSEYPDGPVEELKHSYAWRRKFKGMKVKTATALLTLNFKELDRLYRSEMVLIRNRG